MIRQGNENKNVEIYHYITKGSFDNFLWQTQESKLNYITQIMTSKDPVRSAEDIDEQTMTASDFKALATGNPYLKLKIELENELTLLENQRRAFHRTQDTARNKLEASSRNIPALEKRLARYEQDIVQARNTKEQEFSITIGDKIFDSKSEAGKCLHELLQDNVSEITEVRTIAQYRGFSLRAKTSTPSEVNLNLFGSNSNPNITLMVVGQNQYSVHLDLASELGTIQRINNVIDSIEKDQEKTKNALSSLQEDQETAQEELTKTFGKEEDYHLIKAKYSVLAPLIEGDRPVEEIDRALESFLEQMEEPYQKQHYSEPSV